MSRTPGSRGKHTHEFAERYEALIQKTGADPLIVLFKLLKSRNQPIKLQAAKELLQYRYPKLASAQIAVEAAGQMLMDWEVPLELDAPTSDELANLSAIVGECESVPLG
jgi:hypothetical protein